MKFILFGLISFISLNSHASVWGVDEFPPLGEGEVDVIEEEVENNLPLYNPELSEGFVLGLGVSRLNVSYRSSIAGDHITRFGEEGVSGNSLALSKYFNLPNFKGRDGGLIKLGLLYHPLEFSQSGNTWRTDNVLMEAYLPHWETQYFSAYFGLNYTLYTQGKMDADTYELNQSNFSRELGYRFGFGVAPLGKKSKFFINLNYLSMNQGVSFNKKIDDERVRLGGNLNYSGVFLETEFLF